MGGDFVIGIIVFMILITINFLGSVTKGATRIAEVGHARFTLARDSRQADAGDRRGPVGRAPPGRQASPSSPPPGKLEEQSSFFASMDGASKFVLRRRDRRPDQYSALSISSAAVRDRRRRWRRPAAVERRGTSSPSFPSATASTSQISALIISLAAGLLVAKVAHARPGRKRRCWTSSATIRMRLILPAVR